MDLDRDDTRANLTILFDELIKNKSKKKPESEISNKTENKVFHFELSTTKIQYR